MESRNTIAVLGALCGLLIGCGPKSEAPTPTAEEGGPPAESAETQVVAAGAAAPTGTIPSCTSARGQGVSGNGLQAKVTDGTYCVCDVGAHATHNSREAAHLIENQTVVIQPLDWVTNVQLGTNNLQMATSADGKEMTALVTYSHKDADHPEQSEDVTHLVRIKPETDPRLLGQTGENDCSPDKNVLRITFCAKGDSGWDCGEAREGEEGPGNGLHGGDTHVQN